MGKLGPLQRTNMLANFRVRFPSLGVRHVFEVQFKLQDLFTITLAEHLFYDVIRAQSFQDLASKPIFSDQAFEAEEKPGESVQDFIARVSHEAGLIVRRSMNAVRRMSSQPFM